MNKKYTKDELRWAKELGKKVGIDDPVRILEMRWSEFSALANLFDLQMTFVPDVKPKKKKARR